MRLIVGYLEDYWATRGLEIAVLSFGEFPDRFAALEPKITLRCARIARRLAWRSGKPDPRSHGSAPWACQRVA